jgi:hypothetical protein
MTNPSIRQAIAEALDYPFAEEAMQLIDTIEADVNEDEVTPESTRHEVAAVLTEAILDAMSTARLALLWAILKADGAHAERFGDYSGSTANAVRDDLWVKVEEAVHAGLAARAEEED